MQRMTLAVLAIVALGGCRRSTAPAKQTLALVPAAQAKDKLVVAVTAPDLEGWMARVGAQAKQMGLPFGADMLRRLLVARSTLPDSVVTRLDLGKPLAVVMITLPGTGEDAAASAGTAMVMAGALKDPSPAGYDAFTAALGPVVERRHDAIHVSLGDAGASGSVWLMARDGAVLASQTVEGLTTGGALAAEARGVRGDDLRVTLVMEGLARATRGNPRGAIAHTTQGGDLAKRLTDLLFDTIAADTRQVTLGLSMDGKRGISTILALAVRPGSALAGWPRNPALVPAAMLAGDPPALVGAIGNSAWTAQFAGALKKTLVGDIISDAERVQGIATIDAITTSLAGPFAAVTRFRAGPEPSVAYDLSCKLATDAAGNALLAAIERAVNSPWAARLVDATVGGGRSTRTTTRRDGDALVATITIDTKKEPKAWRPAMAAFPGFDGVAAMQWRAVVANGQLMVTLGGDGAARMARLREDAHGGAALDPVLTNALAEAKDADGFLYTDLGAFVRAGYAMAAKSPVLAQPSGRTDPTTIRGGIQRLMESARVVMFTSLQGGPDGITVRGRIPIGTLESVAQLARTVMATTDTAPPPLAH